MNQRSLRQDPVRASGAGSYSTKPLVAFFMLPSGAHLTLALVVSAAGSPHLPPGLLLACLCSSITTRQTEYNQHFKSDRPSPFLTPPMMEARCRIVAPPCNIQKLDPESTPPSHRPRPKNTRVPPGLASVPSTMSRGRSLPPPSRSHSHTPFSLPSHPHRRFLPEARRRARTGAARGVMSRSSRESHVHFAIRIEQYRHVYGFTLYYCPLVVGWGARGTDDMADLCILVV